MPKMWTLYHWYLKYKYYRILFYFFFFLPCDNFKNIFIFLHFFLFHFASFSLFMPCDITICFLIIVFSFFLPHDDFKKIKNIFYAYVPLFLCLDVIKFFLELINVTIILRKCKRELKILCLSVQKTKSTHKKKLTTQFTF